MSVLYFGSGISFFFGSSFFAAQEIKMVGVDRLYLDQRIENDRMIGEGMLIMSRNCVTSCKNGLFAQTSCYD